MSTKSDLQTTPQSAADTIDILNDENYLTVASTSSTASRADSIADNDVFYSSIYDSGNQIRSPECNDQENQVISFLFKLIFNRSLKI